LTGDADYLVKMVVPDLKVLSRILNNVLLPHRQRRARALLRGARPREADNAVAAALSVRGGGTQGARRRAPQHESD